MNAATSDRGELALVLHTHMPYVEGYGTWPFGEEWLWEALATCYLPLGELLDRRAAADPAGRVPLTLSLTPVLCDQLEAPGVAQRFATFLRDVRRETHRIDIAGCRAGGEEEYARELERAAGDYEHALERTEELGGDLLAALAPHVSWTSSATHAVLPLLATDAGVRLQVQTGIAAHRTRFDGRAGRPWAGGFWLPECAHAPWLDALLEEAGVRAVCVDLTDVLGYGATAQLTPLASADGPLLAPIDRATMELVWSDGGYPSHGAYRDYHAFTVHHHRVWSNAGETYDVEAAWAQARADAADFVARTIARLDAGAAELGRPALAVCALDTELLGHWWYEGIVWLDAVLDEAERQGLALAPLDEALTRYEAVPVADALAAAAPTAALAASRPLPLAPQARAAAAPAASRDTPLPLAPQARVAAAPAELPTTTWGTPRDLSTWDGPQVADLAWQMRAAELRTLGTRPAARCGRPSPRALRELLALQASDWAFLETRKLAGPYARERAAGHAAALDRALAAAPDPADDGTVRNLAPHLPR